MIHLRLIFGLALVFAVSCATASPIDQIKLLIQQGNPSAAYAFAKKHPESLGDPEFDFFFGVAAIDSGSAGEGVLALERYLANFPLDLQGRLELARGYFVLGELARAREEFTEVLKTVPPPSVAVNIERYLDAIRARESAYRTTAGAFIEFGLGHDNNVNGGLSKSDILLPNFGPINIAEGGLRKRSDFSQIAFGFNVIHPVAPGLAIFGSMAGDFRLNQSANDFDQGNHTASGGFSYLKEKNLFRATYSLNQLDLGNIRFRTISAASGEWTRQLDEMQAVSGSFQSSRLAYSDNNRPRDSQVNAVGLTYRKAMVGNLQPQLLIGGNIARENNLRGRDDLGRESTGLRAAFSFTPYPKWAVSLGGAYQRSRHSEADALLSTVRRDQMRTADLTAIHSLRSNLSLRLEAAMIRNSSNLALYEFNRDVIAVKLRYDLK